MKDCTCNKILDCGIVQGIGVTPVEEIPAGLTIFTEISIPEIVKLPDVKPDIEQVVSVTVDACILSLRLIETAIGRSQEFQFISGHKLVVELKLRQKIKYVADEPTQSVHAAHFENVISSVFIVVPDMLLGVNIQDLFDQGRLTVTPYIEDIYAKQRGKREIFKNITVLLNVTAL